MIDVNWEQLKRLLKIDETFAETDDEYESYTIDSDYKIDCRKCDLDTTVTMTYVQLYNDSESGICCIIQLVEGGDPLVFDIETETIQVQRYIKEPLASASNWIDNRI